MCVVSVSPGDLSGTRYVAKRLRTRLPDVMLVIGRLGADSTSERGQQLLKAAGIKDIAVTLQELRANLLPIVNAYRNVAPESKAEAQPETRTSTEAQAESDGIVEAEEAESQPRELRYEDLAPVSESSEELDEPVSEDAAPEVEITH